MVSGSTISGDAVHVRLQRPHALIRRVEVQGREPELDCADQRSKEDSSAADLKQLQLDEDEVLREKRFCETFFSDDTLFEA